MNCATQQTASSHAELPSPARALLARAGGVSVAAGLAVVSTLMTACAARRAIGAASAW